MDSLLTAEQVAKVLNCKVKTVYAWAENGKIPSLKINGLLRFVPAEILEWIKSFRTESKRELKIGTRTVRESSIDDIIKSAIASTKGSRYTSSYKGKPDQVKPERRD